MKSLPVLNLQNQVKNVLHAAGESVNYALMSKQELIALLKEMLDSRPIESIINEVENIKINYYKKHKAEIEKKRKAFVEQGGELEDFQVEDDPFENEIKEQLQKIQGSER